MALRTVYDVPLILWGCPVVIPCGTEVIPVTDPQGIGYAVKSVELLIRLTGNSHDPKYRNSHDPKYRYAWIPATAVGEC